MEALKLFSQTIVLLWLLADAEAIPEETMRSVVGAGASLPSGLYRTLAYAYQFASDTDVTYTSTGSGEGIQLIEGEKSLSGQEVDFVGSEVVLSDNDYEDVPDLQM